MKRQAEAQLGWERADVVDAAMQSEEKERVSLPWVYSGKMGRVKQW